MSINLCERCERRRLLHYNNFLDMVLCEECDEIAMREDAEQDEDR